MVDYGTYAGQSFTRPATPESRDDTWLVTSTAYNRDGEAEEITDPAGTVTRHEFDDAGRRVKLIENKQGTTGPDKNRTTEFVYNSDGLVVELIAHNSTTGNQTAKYVYGTLVTEPSAPVARKDLLCAVIYPDSDDTFDAELALARSWGLVVHTLCVNGRMNAGRRQRAGRISTSSATGRQTTRFGTRRWPLDGVGRDPYHHVTPDSIPC